MFEILLNFRVILKFEVGIFLSLSLIVLFGPSHVYVSK